MNPCFSMWRLSLFSFGIRVSLEIRYKNNEIISSPIMTKNMILQLLRILVEKLRS